jgi:hypothetical protein
VQTWDFEIAKASPVTDAAGSLFQGPAVNGAPRKINHVGLAVPDIETFLGKTAPVRELFVTLLEPLGEGSPLQAFLNRNPMGGPSTSRSRSSTSTPRSRG